MDEIILDVDGNEVIPFGELMEMYGETFDPVALQWSNAETWSALE